jgi:TRAP-type C4-dicarboxylate transport system substrate-binding protein
MLAPKLAADGLEMLSMYEGGQFSFLTVNREIKTIDDFKGLKTRVPPVRMHLDMWKAIGTNPTPIAYGELYTALETGTIDALGINLTSIFSEKFYEVGKHVLQTKHGYWPGVLVMNKRKFDSLKPSYQKAIRQAALETTEPQIEAIIRAEKSLIAKLKALGVEFTEMSPRLKADLKAKVKPVIEQYSKNDPTVVNFVRAVEAHP